MSGEVVEVVGNREKAFRLLDVGEEILELLLMAETMQQALIEQEAVSGKSQFKAEIMELQGIYNELLPVFLELLRERERYIGNDGEVIGEWARLRVPELVKRCKELKERVEDMLGDISISSEVN